jgi:hypothetical protein
MRLSFWHWGFFAIWTWAIFIGAEELVTQSRPQGMVHPSSLTGAKVVRIAILPFCGSNQNCDTSRPGAIKEAFFNHPRGVKAFIENASGGRVKIEGTVTGWINVASPLATAKDVVKRRSELIELAKAELDLGAFDVFYIFANTPTAGTQMGLKSGTQIHVGSGTKDVSVALMINSLTATQVTERQPASVVLPSNSWAHELLHILGIVGHANGMKCQNLTDIKSCQLRAYGDSFSTMGEAAFFLSPNWSMKRDLKWAEPSDILTVTKSGEYTIDQKNKKFPKALEIVLPKAIELKPKVVFDRLWVEQKVPEQQDDILNRLNGSDFLRRFSQKTSFPTDGAFLYFGYQNRRTNTTVLIDTKLNSSGVLKSGIKWPGNPGENADALLSDFSPFAVFNSGLTISLVKKTSTQLTIRVHQALPR